MEQALCPGTRADMAQTMAYSCMQRVPWGSYEEVMRKSSGSNEKVMCYAYENQKKFMGSYEKVNKKTWKSYKCVIRN